MIRYIWVSFLCVLMIGSAAITYKIKYEAELVEEQVTELNYEINALEEEISRLKAHWSFLNQPNRLQRLVEDNDEIFSLEPIRAHQIVRLEDIPLKAPIIRILPPTKPFSSNLQQNVLDPILSETNEPTLADLIAQ